MHPDAERICSPSKTFLSYRFRKIAGRVDRSCSNYGVNQAQADDFPSILVGRKRRTEVSARPMGRIPEGGNHSAPSRIRPHGNVCAQHSADLVIGSANCASSPTTLSPGRTLSEIVRRFGEFRRGFGHPLWLHRDPNRRRR